MTHGVIFLTYNQQGGPRGAGKAESVNWLMVIEQHKLGRAPCSGNVFRGKSVDLAASRVSGNFSDRRNLP